MGRGGRFVIDRLRAVDVSVVESRRAPPDVVAGPLPSSLLAKGHVFVDPASEYWESVKRSAMPQLTNSKLSKIREIYAEPDDERVDARPLDVHVLTIDDLPSKMTFIA